MSVNCCVTCDHFEKADDETGICKWHECRVENGSQECEEYEGPIEITSTTQE